MGPGGHARGYRIRVRFGGQRTLEASEIPRGKPAYVVLHARTPFRRKLQRLPDSDNGRQALLRTAADEFPLPAGQLEFGLGLQGGEAYLLGCPVETFEQIKSEDIDPAIVLIAGGASTEQDCLTAIDLFERYGPSFAIGGTKARYISRLRLGKAFLGGSVFATTVLAAILATVPGVFDGVIAWRTEQLRSEAGDLPRLLKTTESMQATQTDAAALMRSPEAKLPKILAQIFSSVPPRHGIKRIEFDGKELTVAGTGNDVDQWLVSAGFEKTQISIESLGNLPRFRAVQKVANP